MLEGRPNCGAVWRGIWWIWGGLQGITCDNIPWARVFPWDTFFALLLHPGGMGLQGIARGTQYGNVWPAKQTFNKMVLKSVQFHQDFTLSTRILDGALRGNERDARLNVWHVRETFVSFYWILLSLIKISFFPPGSKMGAQETTKGTTMKMSDE